MERRMLGNSGIEISPLVFGGNVLGWTVDKAMGFRLLDAFVDSGLNAIDTADMYSTWAPGNQGGESETIIGQWLQRRGHRAKVVIATKVGMEVGGESGLSRKHILKSVDASLKRLQTDYIDLYQAHQDDPQTSLEETLGTFHELIEQGKVRAIGASNFSAQRLTEALKISQEKNWHRYITLQPHYNLYSREDFESHLEPVCREFNLSVIPYYSLASGFLTGKYRNLSDVSLSQRGNGVVAKYLNERGRRILTGLDQVAEELDSTPARVALAWLMTRVTAPIASATHLEQLSEIVDSTRLALDASSLEILNRVSSP